MRVGHEDTCDEVFVLHRNAGATFTAAMLGAVGRKRCSLDVTAMRHSNHHIFALDQIFIVHIGAAKGKF